MSRRVLTVVLTFFVICVGTPSLHSAESTGPELPIPLIGPTGAGSARQAAPPLAIQDAPSYSAPNDAAPRVAASSSIRWVKPNKPKDRTEIEPIPLACPEGRSDSRSPTAPRPTPSVGPTPTLAEGTARIATVKMIDASDLVPELAEVNGTGIVQAAPSLVVEIAGPSRTSVGSVASFQIFVKNMGVVTAEDIDVQVVLPQHVDFIASSPKADSTDGRKRQFTVGDLAAEAVHQIRLDLVPRSSGEVRLHTNVGFSVAASSSIQVGRAQLAIRCEAPAVTALGDLVTFHVVVENTGDRRSENVTVVPQVASVGQTNMSAAGQFDIGTLQPGDTKQIVLRAIASREGTMQVRFVASDQSGSEAVADTRVRVRPSGMDLMLIGPAEAKPGEEISCEVQVSNATDSLAEDVRVTCSLPKGFRLTVVESSVHFASDFAGMTWRPKRLATGETKVLRFKATAPATEGDYTIRAVLESDALPNPRRTETTISIHKQLQYHRTASLQQ